MGFFRADMADQALRGLQLMDFKNKDQVMSAIQSGQQQAKETEALRRRLVTLAGMVDEWKGTNLAEELAQEFHQPAAKNMPHTVKEKKPGSMETMRQRTQQTVRPR